MTAALRSQSRLALACARLCRAMGDRQPGALVPWTAGAIASALEQAQQGQIAGSDLRSPDLPQSVHPSWFLEALRALPREACLPVLGLLPPACARFAAIAFEKASGSELAGDPGLAGEAAPTGLEVLRIAASSMPPTGFSRPTFIPVEDESHPVEWVARSAAWLPGEAVLSQWPRDAEVALRTMEQALPPGSPAGAARGLVKLASCLAQSPDEGRAFAALVPHRLGLAFLGIRARWALALPASTAQALAQGMCSEGNVAS